MSSHTHPRGTRLAQLHQLLERTLVEIREEEARLFRVEAMRSQIRVPASEDSSTPSEVIRAWAYTQGLRVAGRGPIPKSIRAAYAAAVGVAA